MGSQVFNEKRVNMYMFDPDNVVIVGLDTGDGPEHPLYDERVNLPLDEGLVVNIMYLGKVLETVGVRKDGDVAQCVWGRQRIRCCREANRRLREQGKEPVLVPATFERADEGRLYGMMVSENELRRGDTPMARARKLAKLMDHGSTREDAADTFGVTVQTIDNMLALMDLDKSVQGMVDDGKLSATAAGKLSALPRAEQRVEAKKLVESGNTTVAAASRATKAARNGGDGGPVVPSKKVLRKLLEAEAGALEPEFVRGIRYALGELNPASVKGLTALLDQ